MPEQELINKDVYKTSQISNFHPPSTSLPSSIRNSFSKPVMVDKGDEIQQNDQSPEKTEVDEELNDDSFKNPVKFSFDNHVNLRQICNTKLQKQLSEISGNAKVT